MKEPPCGVEKRNAFDAIEKRCFSRILPAIALRGEDELLDDEPAKAVTDKDDRRLRSAQCATPRSRSVRRIRTNSTTRVTADWMAQLWRGGLWMPGGSSPQSPARRCRPRKQD